MLQKIDNIENLKEKIATLDAQRTHEYMALKSEIRENLTNLKPNNIIKNTLGSITTSTNITDEIASTSLGLATGYISKKLMVGRSINPIKQLLGLVLQFTVARAVAKHPQTVKTIGNYFINLIFRTKNKL